MTYVDRLAAPIVPLRPVRLPPRRVSVAELEAAKARHNSVDGGVALMEVDAG